MGDLSDPRGMGRSSAAYLDGRRGSGVYRLTISYGCTMKTVADLRFIGDDRCLIPRVRHRSDGADLEADDSNWDEYNLVWIFLHSEFHLWQNCFRELI